MLGVNIVLGAMGGAIEMELKVPWLAKAAAVVLVEQSADALSSATRLIVPAFLPAKPAVLSVVHHVNALLLAAIRARAALRTANSRVLVAREVSSYLHFFPQTPQFCRSLITLTHFFLQQSGPGLPFARQILGFLLHVWFRVFSAFVSFPFCARKWPIPRSDVVGVSAAFLPSSNENSSPAAAEVLVDGG
nr:hypothetical protein Iba_chr06eCG3670 [Ipomoea batatas]